MNRRCLIRAVSVGTVLTSGCAAESFLGNSENGGCADADRFQSNDSAVAYGEYNGFKLTASGSELSPGDTVTLHLTNASSEERQTGTDDWFDLQRKHGDGYRSVYFVAEEPAFSDEAVPHEPGEGFEWRFELTQDGLTTETEFVTFRACNEVTPGEYRFLYWGFSGTEESVAVRFRVE